MKVLHVTLQIAILTSAWFLWGSCPAAGQDDQKPTAEPTAKQASAPVEDAAPEKELHAYGPLSLEQAIAQALRTNPDLLIADAKLRQMKAELNRARLMVARDVTAAYQNWASAKQSFLFFEKMQRRGQGTSEGILAEKKRLAASESELMYLLGAGAEAASDGAEPASATEGPGADRGALGNGSWTARQDGVRPEIPQQYREVMKKNVDLEFTDQPLSEVLDYLQSTGGEFSFVFKGSKGNQGLALGMVALRDKPVTLSVRSVTLAAALEGVADQTDVCFVFRDYGVLVVNNYEAQQYRGPAIPGETLLHREFGSGPGGGGGGRR